jgi:hypothetical protein
MLLAARWTNNLAMVAIVPTAGMAGMAGMAGLTANAAYDAHKPLPNPADSVQVYYGLRSSVMWDRYVSGFRDAYDDHRRTEVKVLAIGTVVVGILFTLFIAFLRAIAHAIS